MKAIPSAARALALAPFVLLWAEPVLAERLPLRRYTTADGLAHDRVKRIVQDSHGLLWLCTAHGLSRFDGYGFTTYGREQGLPHPSTNDLLEDGDGQYWIATNGGGVCRFSAAATRCQAYPVGQTFLSNRVNVLHKDRAGRLWAGTDAGVFRLDTRGPGHAFAPVDLGGVMRSDPFVPAIAEDREGSVWIATGGGLLRVLPEGRVVRVVLGEETDPSSVRALLLDPAGRLWVGQASGLVVLNPAPASAGGAPVTLRDQDAGALADLAVAPGTAWRFREMSEGTGSAVLAMVRSARGLTWLGTSGGLVQVDRGRFRRLPPPRGLSELGVIALTEDREGNLWAGTFAGAVKVIRNGFTTYDEADGLANDRISAVFEARDGQLVVITAAGLLHRFVGERFIATRIEVPEGFAAAPGGYGQIALQDREGDWWLRSRQGLFRLRSGRDGHLQVKARYTTRDGLPSDNVSRVFEDSRGTIWIGGSAREGGVVASWERATGRFRRLPLPPRVPPWAAPTSFGEDRGAHLWVGFGQEGGLVTFRGDQVVVPDMGEMPPGPITSVHFDREGRLWFAAGTAGLGRIDDPQAGRPQVRRYGEGQGLSGGSILSVTEDEWGRIYLGSLSGVHRLDPQSGRLRNYTTADGLAQNEQLVAWRDRQNRLWFGTTVGLSRLLPEHDPPRPAPGVRITGLRIAGAAQPLSALGESTIGPLELDPDQNQIQLEYMSIGFATGETLHYQYRLEGADREWSPPSADRTVNYASLRPGAYRFRVRALNADGVPSTEPASVAFVVLAPVWRRAWFLALLASVAGLAIHGAYRLRLRRLVELERVRTRIASDLHDDIGSNLSQIAILGEVAHRRLNGAPPEVAEPLALIGTLSRETVDSMGDIVWAIDPHKDRLGNLAHRMRRLASDALGARGIALSFQADEAAEQVALGADVRRQVYLIFKEGLHNAARHSACTRVEVGLRLEAGRLVMEVADDGQGFDPASVDQGHGLSSLQQRARELGGTLEVASGAGTRLTLRVPCRG
jgi:ligand-binding sensor domain-containing protein/signal transduction histidine kinase